MNNVSMEQRFHFIFPSKKRLSVALRSTTAQIAYNDMDIDK